jgi:hypothetical protein
MKHPTLGITYAIVFSEPITAKEVRQAVEIWHALHPQRTNVHVKIDRCDDCDHDTEHFTNVTRNIVTLI